MALRSLGRGRIKKQVPTTLGRAPSFNNMEPADLSHLRKPIETSLFGLKQVLTLFETATDEVRRYILHECNIIYECRICRSLFRSLANFILHKRSYCQEFYEPVCNSKKTNKEENSYEICSDAVEDVDMEEEEKTPKTLSGVLKKLAEHQENIKVSKEISQKELSPEKSNETNSDFEKTQNKLHLEKIENSNSGVFQTIPNGSVGNDLMRSEVMEIHSILNNNEAILQPDGKAFSFGSERNKSNVVKPKLICTICSLKFSTKKTLTYHIKYKHNDTRLFYLCPECKDTFANAWCVFRHLYKVHRKTTPQIRKLRDIVHSTIIVKKQNSADTKEKSLPGEANSMDRENQWLNNLEGDMDLQMCGGCGKRFERRAALHSHSQTCMKRMAVCNSIKKTVEEKPVKQKSQNVVVKGSKKRKPNFSRKLVKPNNKAKEPETNVKEPESAAKKTTQIEEVIFGNVEAAMENNGVSETRDGPIIILHSDDEDTIGFPNENEKSVEIEKNNKEKEITEAEKDSSEIENKEDERKESESTDLIQEEVNNKNDEGNEYNLEHEINNECLGEYNCEGIFDNLKLDLIVNEIPQLDPDIIVDLTDDTFDITDTPESEKNLPVSNQQETNILLSILDEASKPQSPSSSPVLSTNRSEGDDQQVPIEETSSSSILEAQEASKPSKKRKRVSDETSLKTKSENYVNWELLQCNSCNTIFKTNDLLMEHMALHFDWFRFQCGKCTFLSYNNKTCSSHLEIEHKIDPIISESYVLPLPNWKVLKLSSDFKSLNPAICKDLEDIEIAPDLDNLNKQDPLVRKMIMEVIFGPNAIPNMTSDAKLNMTRSRNCVKTLDKDFVYDMNIVDTQIRNQAAIENKVKPIKIIKNKECDFKVINLSPAHQKRKKWC